MAHEETKRTSESLTALLDRVKAEPLPADTVLLLRVPRMAYTDFEALSRQLSTILRDTGMRGVIIHEDVKVEVLPPETVVQVG